MNPEIIGHILTIFLMVVSGGIAVGTIKSSVKSLTGASEKLSAAVEALHESSLRHRSSITSLEEKVRELRAQLSVVEDDCDKKFRHVENGLNMQVKDIRGWIQGITDDMLKDQKKTRQYQAVFSKAMFVILVWISQQQKKSGNGNEDAFSEMIKSSKDAVDSLSKTLNGEG